MIDYKGINIISAEEAEILGVSLVGINSIFPMLYISPNTKLSKLIEVIGMDKTGAYDYAVPESWARENNYPQGYDRAVWYYPSEGEGRLFGYPVTVRTMMYDLKDMICEDHPDFFKWIKENWEVIE